MPRPLIALAAVFAVVIIGGGALLYLADLRAVREFAGGVVGPTVVGPVPPDAPTSGEERPVEVARVPTETGEPEAEALVPAAPEEPAVAAGEAEELAAGETELRAAPEEAEVREEASESVATEEASEPADVAAVESETDGTPASQRVAPPPSAEEAAPSRLPAVAPEDENGEAAIPPAQPESAPAPRPGAVAGVEADGGPAQRPGERAAEGETGPVAETEAPEEPTLAEAADEDAGREQEPADELARDIEDSTSVATPPDVGERATAETPEIADAQAGTRREEPEAGAADDADVAALESARTLETEGGLKEPLDEEPVGGPLAEGEAAVATAVKDTEEEPPTEVAAAEPATEDEAPAETRPRGQAVVAPEPAPEDRTPGTAAESPGEEPATEPAGAAPEVGEAGQARPVLSGEAGQAEPRGSGATAEAEPGAVSRSGPPVAGGEALTDELQVAAAAPPGIPDAVDVTIKAAEAETGTLYVAGEAPAGALLNIYADGELVGEAQAGTDGVWLLQAEKEVPAGEMVLRVEAEFGEAPAPAAAAEASFLRHPDGIVLEPVVTAERGEGSLVRASASPPMPTYVIIRRGDNLWRIARRNYGRGIRYGTIFDANRDRIRNPHLIFPGQVFVVPTADRSWAAAAN